MNCKEALEKLYEYLDRELHESTRKELDQHLQFCGDCLKKYQLEESIQKLVTGSCGENCDLTPLKQRIRLEIDKIDKTSRSKNIFYLLGPIVAAAIIAAFVFLPRGDSPDMDRFEQVVTPFAAEHTRCLEHLLNDAVSSDDPQVIDSALSEHFDLPAELFSQKAEGVSIAGAAIAHLATGKIPHLDYSAYGENVSLFVLPQGFLDKAGFVEKGGSDNTYWTGKCPRYHYVVWECEGKECIAVSKLPEENLIHFAALF